MVAEAIQNLIINELRLFNFRNHSDSEFSFCPKINCLVGQNGVGKTNVLEAIYYLSMTKAYSALLDRENIRYEQEFFTIQAQYLRCDTVENIVCGLKQKKQVRRNNKEYERMADHIGLLPIVAVSPNDIQLVIGGSEERRRFFNEIISQCNPQYLRHNISYNRALKQRNALLKQMMENDSYNEDLLSVWTEPLIESGEYIYQQRLQFCRDIASSFQFFYQTIAGNSEEVSLVYESQQHQKSLQELIRDSLASDRLSRHTSHGPHKDDLLFRINDRPIRKFGSQGQQKTYLLALRLAAYNYLQTKLKIAPILLLDDIFDKFDSQRVQQILHLIASPQFGQTFITDTNLNLIQNLLQNCSCEHQVINLPL